MSTRDEWIPSGEIDLVGVFHLPEGEGPHPAVVVCHPHPRYGGDMANNVVMAVCEALVERGIAALRFNFRGVGRSGGSFDNGRGETDDVLAAARRLSLLPEIAPERVGLVGYSFGALVSVAAALRWGGAIDSPLLALGLIAPPVQAISAENVDAIETAALLIVTGDRDPIAPAAAVRELGAAVRDCTVQIVPGAEHSWSGFEDDLAGIVGPFFLQRLRGEEGS